MISGKAGNDGMQLCLHSCTLIRNFLFGPGFSEGRRAIFDTDGRQIAGMFDGRKDRSLQLKLTYSFDY